MMNCSEAKELIHLYIDNELDARHTLAAQQHFEACAACASQLDYFLKQDQALKQSAQSEIGDNALVRENILAAIRQENATANQQATDERRAAQQKWLRRPVLLRLAAGFILVIAVAFFLLRGSAPFINDKVYAAAVEDHTDHCTLEVIDKLKRTVSDIGQIDKLCAENGKFKKTPDLSVYGFAEVRARYCGFDGVKVLHLVYQSETEKPLSVFMCLHNTKLIADQLVLLKKDGCEVASFTKDGVDLLVVSSSDEKRTAAIAKSLADSL